MKAFATSFLTTLAIGAACIAAAYWLAGCKSMTPEQQAALVQSIATDAAAIGASVDLQQNPTHRPLYVACKGALDKIISDGTWDAVEFQRALRLLPVGALRGENGALIAQGILSVFTLATGYIDIANAPPLLRAAIIGCRDGLAQALAGTPAIPALRAGKPVHQIELPPR